MQTKYTYRALATLILVAGGTTVTADTAVSLGEVRTPDANETVNIIGYLQSDSMLALSMPISGTLNFSAEVGTEVAAGDVVASIDDREIVLKIEEQKVIVSREAISHEYYSSQVGRLKLLDAQQHTSKSKLAEWESLRDEAKANHRIAQLHLMQLREQRKKMLIKSPLNGVVYERLLQGGEQVGAGEPVVRVVDNVNLIVVAAVPVRHRGRLIPYARAKVFADAYTTTATLEKVIPVGDIETQQFEVRLSVAPESLDKWSIGHLLSVQLPLKSEGYSQQVPRDAVLHNGEQDYVLLASKEEVVTEVLVSTGHGDGDWVTVHGALSNGDQVVVRGGEGLKTGESIRVSKH